METMCTALSHVVLNLQSQLNLQVASRSEFAVDDFKLFMEQQTNVVVQSIQALLLILKVREYYDAFRSFPSTQNAQSDHDLVTALDTVVAAVTRFKNVITYTLNVPEQAPPAEVLPRVDEILASLATLVAYSLDIRQNLVEEGVRPESQAVASLVYTVAKHTKELVLLVGSN